MKNFPHMRKSASESINIALSRVGNNGTRVYLASTIFFMVTEAPARRTAMYTPLGSPAASNVQCSPLLVVL
jgi:hypothetical protein